MHRSAIARAKFNAALPDSILIDVAVAKLDRKPTFRFHNRLPGNLWARAGDQGNAQV
jgi:hypothetical protein